MFRAKLINSEDKGPLLETSDSVYIIWVVWGSEWTRTLMLSWNFVRLVDTKEWIIRNICFMTDTSAKIHNKLTRSGRPKEKITLKIAAKSPVWTDL